MAGTLKVGTITTPSGSGTITIPSGVTLSGVTNTPAFHAYKTANQDIAEATDTKVTWDNVSIDTNSAFSTTNNRFTVPSNQAGKYFFSGSMQTSSVGQSEYQYGFLIIHKNGSRVAQQLFDNRNTLLRDIPITFSYLIDLSVSDYIEIFINLGTTGANQRIKGDASYIATWFSGYKLIG